MLLFWKLVDGNSNFPTSGIYRCLQTKSNLHISICQSHFKRNISMWNTLYFIFQSVFSVMINSFIDIFFKISIPYLNISLPFRKTKKRKFREKNRCFRNRENVWWAWPFSFCNSSFSFCNELQFLQTPCWKPVAVRDLVNSSVAVVNFFCSCSLSISYVFWTVSRSCEWKNKHEKAFISSSH